MPATSPRLTVLRDFAAKQPNDPFPRYGVAMELKGLGETAEAWTTFAELLEKHPAYLATYAPAADLLATQGKTAEAISLYEKGIATAAAQGNHHIKDLLVDALSALLA